MEYSQAFEKWWASLLGLKPSDEAKPLAWLGWKASKQDSKDKSELAEKKRKETADRLSMDSW